MFVRGLKESYRVNTIVDDITDHYIVVLEVFGQERIDEEETNGAERGTSINYKKVISFLRNNVPPQITNGKVDETFCEFTEYIKKAIDFASSENKESRGSTLLMKSKKMGK